MIAFSTTKFIVASLVSSLVMFMLAGLWNVLVVPHLGVAFPNGLLRQVPIFPLVILGYLILGAVVVYIGSRSSFTANRRLHWCITGILVMEIAFGFSSLVLQGYYTFPLNAIPYDLIWYIVEGGLGGLVVSLFESKNR